MTKRFIPQTPGGTLCDWIAADTEEQAWANLLRDAAHMPYGNKRGFQRRGYVVIDTSAPIDWTGATYELPRIAKRKGEK